MLSAIIHHALPPVVFLTYLIIFLSINRIVIFIYSKSISKESGKKAAIRHVVIIINGFYSIFLGFIIYILWNNYQKSEVIVVSESAKLYAVWESTRIFPSKFAQKMQASLEDYLSAIINDEWQTIPYEKMSQKTQLASNNVYATLRQYRPSDLLIQIYYGNALSSFNDAMEYRVLRLNMLHAAMPAAWYVIIFFGAFVLIGIFSTEMDLKKSNIPIILCIFLAIYMTAVTLLSFPFAGYKRITNEPFVHTLRLIKESNLSMGSDSTDFPYH